jgi:hypothetical protein
MEFIGKEFKSDFADFFGIITEAQRFLFVKQHFIVVIIPKPLTEVARPLKFIKKNGVTGRKRVLEFGVIAFDLF